MVAPKRGRGAKAAQAAKKAAEEQQIPETVAAETTEPEPMEDNNGQAEAGEGETAAEGNGTEAAEGETPAAAEGDKAEEKAEEKVESGKLLVENLPSSYLFDYQEKLKELFSKHGEVIGVKRGPIIVTELTTTPTLSAIVEFKNKDSVEKALAENGVILDGCAIALAAESRAETAVLVGVPYEASTEYVRLLFSQCGEIAHIHEFSKTKYKILRVTFLSGEGVEKALKLDRELRVNGFLVTVSKYRDDAEQKQNNNNKNNKRQHPQSGQNRPNPAPNNTPARTNNFRPRPQNNQFTPRPNFRGGRGGRGGFAGRGAGFPRGAFAGAPYLPPQPFLPARPSNLSSGIDQSSEPSLSAKHKLPSEEDRNVKKLRSTEQEKKSSPCCSNASSPRKRKLKNIICNKDSVIKQQRSKIRKLQAQNRRLKKKVTKVEEILEELQKNLWIRNEEASVLKNTNVQVQELMARYIDKEQSGNTRAPYSPALRSFALTLHYYSPKAYEHVRQTFNTCLPHASTLRKWYSSVNGDPGFTSESFAALKAKAETTDYTILAALTMDEMAIRKRIEWDGQRFHGCVEFGSSTENDLLAEAKEALVFLITAINSNFKIPVAYFLVDGVTGTQRADLVKQCLERIHETGIQVVSLTFDGCASNVAMMHELGCSLANNNIQFNHPITNNPVVAILDPSHMVKLIRNTFQMYKTLIDRDGNKICWSYLEELNKIQETEKFHLANKLRNLHINFENQKMKVKLATQIFSASVADALNFCEKQLQLPAFANSAPTAFFIKIVNNLFDIYNSRNMFQQGFKKPINCFTAA